MNRALRQGLLWILPAAIVAVYASLLLTNGSLGDFFQPTAWGSLLYANVWEHLTHGNLHIDPQVAPGEYFIVGPGQYVTYFGIMPALLRGLASIVAPPIYSYSLANLSMVAATLLALGSVWYAVQRLAHYKRSVLILGASIVIALLIASPLSYLLTWSWTYHEVILWGVAWALLFTSLYALWTFDRGRFTRWHGALLGLAVGMAVLCRPTIGLTLAVPYAFLCLQALLLLRQRQNLMVRLLWPGALVCLVLAATVLFVNYARWGSPLTFVRLGQNVQFVELYPERRTHIEQMGEFNLARIPTSLYYYLIPSLGNITTKPPFITIDRELAHLGTAPHYDYIEGSRVPLALSSLYILVLACFGALQLKRLRRKQQLASAMLLVGASLTALSLLTVYAVALRYTAEFLPAVTFLALTYIAVLGRKPVHDPLKRKQLLLWSILCLLSAGMTLATTLAYKQFVWDVPASVRRTLEQRLNYIPGPHDTKHIIDGKRFPIY